MSRSPDAEWRRRLQQLEGLLRRHTQQQALFNRAVEAARQARDREQNVKGQLARARIDLGAFNREHSLVGCTITVLRGSSVGVAEVTPAGWTTQPHETDLAGKLGAYVDQIWWHRRWHRAGLGLIVFIDDIQYVILASECELSVSEPPPRE